MYEPPLSVAGSRIERPEDLAARLAGLVAAGRRGEAVELYQKEHIGLPADVVAQIRQAPFRPALEAMAHTLVIAGGASLPFMREMAPALADAIPNARACVFEGQTHDLVPQTLAPVLEEFFVTAR